jgi:type IV pilus assembly protein PilM
MGMGPMPGPMGPMGGGASRNGYSQSSGSRGRQSDSKKGEASGDGGFVIVIEGHSPYKNINDLLDPPGASKDRAKWGMITRLENLGVVCPNSPFKLFNKTNLKDFSIDFGEVDLSGAAKSLPSGIGVEKQQTGATPSTQRVLIDPMTQEVISKETEVDSKGNPKQDRFGKPLQKVNDYWFRIRMKILWNEQPKTETGSPDAKGKKPFGK